MTETAFKKELILVVDPMCSWCWGFAPAVSSIREKYAERLSLAVVVGGLRAGNDKVMDDEAKGTIRHHWEDVNKATGQPFDFDFFKRDDFTYDTEPACRAVVTVRALKRRRPELFGTAAQKFLRQQSGYHRYIRAGVPGCKLGG